MIGEHEVFVEKYFVLDMKKSPYIKFAHILSLFGNYNLLIISLIGAKEMIYNIDKQ